ncbi:MAG: DUF503 domain-containing protein [Chloroflexi bacterium]|nr:DUF503 domain-containing protein [Chloroflexota bacterium]
MFIGVGKVKLRLPENHSLKGKRHVLKSVMGRVRNEFGVSIAEVESQDLWQVAQLGVCYVSNDAQHAMEVISKVVSFIERMSLDAEIIDFETEVVESL